MYAKTKLKSNNVATQTTELMENEELPASLKEELKEEARVHESQCSVHRQLVLSNFLLLLIHAVQLNMTDI